MWCLKAAEEWKSGIPEHTVADNSNCNRTGTFGWKKAKSKRILFEEQNGKWRKKQ